MMNRHDCMIFWDIVSRGVKFPAFWLARRIFITYLSWINVLGKGRLISATSLLSLCSRRRRARERQRRSAVAVASAIRMLMRVSRRAICQLAISLRYVGSGCGKRGIETPLPKRTTKVSRPFCDSRCNDRRDETRGFCIQSRHVEE